MRKLTFRDPFRLRVHRPQALVDESVVQRISLPGFPQPIARLVVITAIQEKGNAWKHSVRHESSLSEKGILHIWAGRSDPRVVVELDHLFDRSVVVGSVWNDFHIAVVVQEENFHVGIA